ncbi:unnamed protein product, partial [Polarella glacialis]
LAALRRPVAVLSCRSISSTSSARGGPSFGGRLKTGRKVCRSEGMSEAVLPSFEDTLSTAPQNFLPVTISLREGSLLDRQNTPKLINEQKTCVYPLPIVIPAGFGRAADE